jgi:hypothetical protein
MVVDLNGDGLLDVLVVNRWDKAQVWRQTASGAPADGSNWLQLRLQQATSNRDAVGAWVEVRLGENANDRVIRQELTVGGGHASGHMGWMHFGLGKATRVQLRVQWPGGTWSPWQPAAANAFYEVTSAGPRTWKAP